MGALDNWWDFAGQTIGNMSRPENALLGAIPFAGLPLSFMGGIASTVGDIAKDVGKTAAGAAQTGSQAIENNVLLPLAQQAAQQAAAPATFKAASEQYNPLWDQLTAGQEAALEASRRNALMVNQMPDRFKDFQARMAQMKNPYNQGGTAHTAALNQAYSAPSEQLQNALLNTQRSMAERGIRDDSGVFQLAQHQNRNEAAKMAARAAGQVDADFAVRSADWDQQRNQLELQAAQAMGASDLGRFNAALQASEAATFNPLKAAAMKQDLDFGAQRNPLMLAAQRQQNEMGGLDLGFARDTYGDRLGVFRSGAQGEIGNNNLWAAQNKFMQSELPTMQQTMSVQNRAALDDARWNASPGGRAFNTGMQLLPAAGTLAGSFLGPGGAMAGGGLGSGLTGAYNASKNFGGMGGMNQYKNPYMR